MEYILHDEIERLEKENERLKKDKLMIRDDVYLFIRYIAYKQMNVNLEDKEIKHIKNLTKRAISRDMRLRGEIYYDALKELDLID
jgi:hypothetical protein